MTKPLPRGVCRQCGETRGIYTPTRGLCRKCNDAPKTRGKAQGPAGHTVKSAPAPQICPLCPPTEPRAASALYGGYCLKHGQQQDRPLTEPVWEGLAR